MKLLPIFTYCRRASFTVSVGCAGLCGCAGPTTPLGAVWAVTPSQVKSQGAELSEIAGTNHVSTEEPEPTPVAPEPTPRPQYALKDPSPKIHFSPSRQILHGPTPVRIVIQDEFGDMENYRLFVRYNGVDVSRAFLRRARINKDRTRRTLTIENPLVRLPANSDHLIEVGYRSSSGAFAYQKYDPPHCLAFREEPVRHLGDFEPYPNTVRIIEIISKRSGINPAFFTALVAQESGFNPKVVSWARAVGLTQITPVAEAEFIDRYTDWPRYPGLKNIPVPVVKAMILSGKVNAKNEWKLDPSRSVQGGINYTLLMAEKWSSPDLLARIKSIFRDPEAAHTQLILASYHSGYSRVLSALSRYGKHWLRAPELKEARKYVNRIFSYCDYFSDSEVSSENTS